MTPEAPEAPSSEPTPRVDLHERASHVLHSLDVFLKQGLRLYSEGHPVVERYRETLTRQMMSFLRDAGPVTFRLVPFELHYEGRRVYRDDEIVPENFVHRLYRDGVRELTLLPELEPKELYLFCQTLATEPGLLAFMGETLADRLFDVSLSSVQCSLVPPVLLSDFDISLTPEEEGAIQKSTDYAVDGLEATLSHYAHSAAEDRQILRRELRNEGRGEIRRLVSILIDILLSNEVEEDRLQVRANLGSMLESLPLQDDTEVAVNALARLKEEAQSSDVAAEELKFLVHGLSASPMIPIMVEKYGDDGAEDPDLIALISYMDEQIGPFLLTLLERVHDLSLFGSLQETAARLLTVEQLTAFLQEQREVGNPLTMSSTLEALGKVNTLASRRVLADVALEERHPMRLRAIELLLDSYSADLEAPLAELLDDPDPRIRHSVTEGMLRADPPAAKLRITMTLEDHLSEDEPDEVGHRLASLYLSLDKTECVVYLLSRLSDRHGPLALRLVAAELLGSLPDNERVRRALEKERDRWLNPRSLKEACAAALRT